MANPKDLRRRPLSGTYGTEGSPNASLRTKIPESRQASLDCKIVVVPFRVRSSFVIRSHAFLGPECMAAYHFRRSCRGAPSTPTLEPRSRPDHTQSNAKFHVLLP